MRYLSKLSLNQRLGVLALALGGLAVFANVSPGRTVKLNAKEILTGVERQEDHVRPAELAGWIIEGRSDYRLVDIRGEKDFAEYHIPTAENVPLATITDGTLGPSEKVVLYGDGAVHAAQAWMVLKGKGHTRVYTLLEGLDAWKNDVLFPALPQSPTREQQARFERSAQVAKFFGGQPRAAATAGSEPVALPAQAALPQVAPPSLPAGASSSPKKKREGC